MPEIALPDVVAALLALSINAYVLLGGADFGGGVWDLLATGPRRARQREVIAHAIGPIWEANHVWLILAVVLAFTCFSPAFARIMTVLHIPLSLMLVGIVLRGSAFTFRTYDDEHDAAQRRWGRIFSSASVLTPLLLGVSLGAVASGRVVAPTQGTFVERFVEPWLTPFAFGVGLLTLALFAFLAAVFLTLETRDRELVEDFRRRALGAGVAVFFASALVLLLSFREAPLLSRGLMASGWALPLHLATAASAIAVFAALWRRRFRLARLLVGLQVSLIFWGWTVSQYPYLVPPDLTIHGAAAPAITLRLTLWALGLGTVVLAPSLVYLFRVFKSEPAA
ncbi:MAG TPA: cytochrome d ubiquinol oxidase subunit II [Gemmatimonadales bacterium]|jgi:cytochrome d ubiquinol oxidase subunit II|nr:cytochrome d ubiquinol oxidase subunit II [Gemmatimonadales bacterium]